MAADGGSEATGPEGGGFAYDVFLSHASENKATFVEDLFRALTERGMRVWYDAFEVGLGDDFRRKMEAGLLGSRYGAVVLSASFLEATKYWPQLELSALFNLEAAGGEKRILPILLGIDWPTLTRALPFLATRRAANASAGVDVVANEIQAELTRKTISVGRRSSPLYAVPLPSQSFVGRRRELDALERALAQAGDVQVCTSIEGLPGIGKTELVLKAAHELAAAGEFPGGIFWLPAETADLTTAWASDAIAGRLGVVGETARDRASNVVNALGRREARVLVILDNVERWDSGGQPQPLPAGLKVTLLVTTRRRHLGGSRFRAFPLDVLAEADARSLLAGLAGTAVAARPGFEELLREIDGHALAVELAGVYLREYPEVTPQEYLDQLRAGRDLGAKVADEVRYERSADQALALLWQRLDPSVRRSWRVASFFAPEPATAALAQACGLDGDGRRALHRYHLIDLDPDGRFRMHRLTRAFGRRAGAEDARDEARDAFVEGVARRAGDIDLAAGFRIYAPDRAHFDEALRLAREDGSRHHASVLLDRVGTAQQSMGELARARELLEAALASDLKNLGEDHPAVARGRSNLAVVLQDLGELAGARELLEAALASALKNLGEDHPAVATGRYNLATILEEEGDLARARELLALVVGAERVTLGPDHPSLAVTRARMARLVFASGDVEVARAEAREAVRIVSRQPVGSRDRKVVENLTAPILAS